MVHSALDVPAGGAEQYVLRLSIGLAERGHDVAIATSRLHPTIVPGVPVFVLTPWLPYRPDANHRPLPARLAWHVVDVFNMTVLPSFRAALRTFRPEIVHTHNFQGLSAAVLAPKTAPSVHTTHDFSLLHPRNSLLRRDGTVLQDPPLGVRLRSRFLHRRLASTRVIFPSDRVRKVHERFGVVFPHARVIPHGWKLEGLVTNTKNRSRLRFLFLGRLIHEKGVRLLLDAWGKGIPGAELLIAGDGPLRREVQRRQAEADGVRLVGWVTGAQKTELLGGADILLLPSRGPEVFPLAAAEAILAGLPLIASDLASPPLLRDGMTGTIVRGGAVEWRRVLETAVRCRNLVDRWTSAAREAARELDWETHLDRITRTYEESPR